MKRTFSILTALLLLAVSQLSAQEAPDRIIQKVANKLASVEKLGYKYSFEFNYPSQGRTISDKADAYLDLKPADKGSRFRFQFSGVDRFSAYNGTERFTLDKKGKKLYVESDAKFDSFGDIFLMNAPLALKYALPRILANKAIQKKVTATATAYVIEFGLPKGILTAEGEIVEIRPDQTNLYRLTVDKKTLLPIEVVQSNDKNDESIKTTYSDVTEAPAMPDGLSWFYSSYLKDYALQKKDKLTLIEKGKPAPEFSLATFESPAKVSLDQFKGKVVLLEFWIAHCGFCIAAVPKLNVLKDKFPDVEIVSINMYDPPVTIDAFKKKNKPGYSILTGGYSVATAFGVEAFPAFVLIGRSGNIAYSSSGLVEQELESSILGNLGK